MNDDNEFEVAPGPLAMFRKIPAKWRWWLYSVGITVFAIEGILDASQAGIIGERPQGVAVAILGLFGFGIAAANVKR